MSSDIHQRIQAQIENSPVLLYMKGTRRAPQCGFSATVVQILDSVLGDYDTVNVLEDPDVRQGIKEFSDWPTIPQLYVKGTFLGGCDIVKELFANGELEPALGLERKEVSAPSVSVTEAAAAALMAALDNDQEYVRLEVDAKFNHGLTIGGKNAGDLEVNAGALTLLVDRSSAARAQGVSIDYVDTETGKAFKIDNPNEPPGVRAISVSDLKQRLDKGQIALFDVRTPEERELARLESSRLLTREAQDEIFALPKDTPLYFICHSGRRSAQAAEFFVEQGYTEVYNVSGGIDAWSRDVDPDVPRYE
jgi:monothiol glutaredoxin